MCGCTWMDPTCWNFADVLEQIKDIPISIDHMGRVDFSLGLDQPAVRWILRMLERDNWWMMVSNGNRTSAFESGWDDAVPVWPRLSRSRSGSNYLGDRLAACALA